MISKEEMYKAMDVRFGKDIHDKLRNGRVAIAGLGGLGSHIAIMLARCGIENLCIIDFDKIDITNLNRHSIYICSPIITENQRNAEHLRPADPCNRKRRVLTV